MPFTEHIYTQNHNIISSAQYKEKKKEKKILINTKK
jgi:hypothetical protein